jgi:hypothetical protein
MSTEENIKALERAVSDYYKAVHKLHEEMEVSDTPGDYDAAAAINRSLSDVRKVLASAEPFLRNVEVRAQLQSHINYHFRARLYVVKRKKEAAGTPLLWAELNNISEGPFTWGFSVLDVCRRQRDRNNALENSERPNVRGWRPGLYVWEIWGYSPEQDVWSLVE